MKIKALIVYLLVWLASCRLPVAGADPPPAPPAVETQTEETRAIDAWIGLLRARLHCKPAEVASRWNWIRTFGAKKGLYIVSSPKFPQRLKMFFRKPEPNPMEFQYCLDTFHCKGDPDWDPTSRGLAENVGFCVGYETDHDDIDGKLRALPDLQATLLQMKPAPSYSARALMLIWWESTEHRDTMLRPLDAYATFACTVLVEDWSEPVHAFVLEARPSPINPSHPHADRLRKPLPKR